MSGRGKCCCVECDSTLDKPEMNFQTDLRGRLRCLLGGEGQQAKMDVWVSIENY